MAFVAGAATAAVACAGAAPAAAAPVFTKVGQEAPGEYSGGCPAVCNAVQRTSNPAGIFPYTFPHDGVLTRFSVRKGSSIATFGGEWMWARTFRAVDATHSRVISESTQGILDPATPSTTQTYWDQHVAATAGDLLGAKFHTGAYIGETPRVYTATSAASDSAAVELTSPGPGPRIGQDVVASASSSLRVNVSARLEHDTDHDGYGDGSQDLCVGDPAHTSTRYKQVGFVCSYACARVQLTSGGVPTSPTADGVVVRWRVQAPKPGDYHIVILAPAGGGNYTYTRVSDTVTIGTDEALWTFPTRLSIKAGGYVALVPPAFAIETSFETTPVGATLTTVGDSPVGSSTTLPSSIAATILYDADIEPDADRDSYGDVTQDACPTNATTHGVCPARPPPPAPPLAPATVFASFGASASSLRVSQTGRFSYSFTATPLSLGKVSLKGTRKVKIGSKKRFMTIAAKSFTAPSAGNVKVKLKLSSRNLKALRKARKVRFVVTVTLGGKTFTTSLALKAPKK
jgi:hypothetical protein